MRLKRTRKKKLIVAFHFQLGNQTAWKCDVCRRNGLEAKRRCGWRKETNESSAAVVWARERHSLTTCPTSYITAESQVLLEGFYAWKLMGVNDFYDLPARLVEAIFILENELTLERRNAQI